MKRNIGDQVRINPYSLVTGEIIDKKDKVNAISTFGYDYKIKLNIPYPNKDTIYTYNYDKENEIWWQFFNDDELDILEKNYEMVSR